VGRLDAVQNDLTLAGLAAGRLAGEQGVQGGVEPERDPAHPPADPALALAPGRGCPTGDGRVDRREDTGRSSVTPSGAVSVTGTPRGPHGRRS
jgi:hypothetical protein